jgi:hypothetical protein
MLVLATQFNTFLNIASVKSTFSENSGKCKISVDSLLSLAVWTPKYAEYRGIH